MTETYCFHNRWIKGEYTLPLQPRKYDVVNDFYEVDRKPRIGESGTAYMNYAKQTGKLLKTTYEKLVVK